ncbi:large neutral amino acids transporter small subunit 2-like, partial [Limulus polyphemus]|uniref:Large neutral amino acids transporter small subunit 2-like n=1 Tax=Limulus polyphemus TaxID=6850 RepID=A0ABM1C342_LIMPO
NLPRAIWIGIPLVTFFYVLTNVAYFTVVSPSEMVASHAVAVTFAERMFGAVAWIMPVCVGLSTVSAVNGLLFTSGRIFLAGAQEGYLPLIFGMIHYKRCTPTSSLIFTCGLSLLMLASGDIYQLINYFSFVYWLGVAVTITGLLFLRFKKPCMRRPVKVTLFVPVLFLFCCLFLTVVPVYAQPTQTGIGLVVALSGVPVYFGEKKWSRKPNACGSRF